MEYGDFGGDYLAHIILTTYNRQDLLDHTLRSLASTTDPDKYRLWILDDASDDETPVYLASYRHSSLAGVVLGRERLHQHGRLNQGFELVRDWKRQWGFPSQLYVVKLEDDVSLHTNWLDILHRVWCHGAARHNLGMLGGFAYEDNEWVQIDGIKVSLQWHVSGPLMMAPFAMWDQYLPIPWRLQCDPARRVPSATDWFLTEKGITGIRQFGRHCGLVRVCDHLGTGRSWWEGSVK